MASILIVYCNYFPARYIALTAFSHFYYYIDIIATMLRQCILLAPLLLRPRRRWHISAAPQSYYASRILSCAGYAEAPTGVLATTPNKNYRQLPSTTLPFGFDAMPAMPPTNECKNFRHILLFIFKFYFAAELLHRFRWLAHFADDIWYFDAQRAPPPMRTAPRQKCTPMLPRWWAARYRLRHPSHITAFNTIGSTAISAAKKVK